MCRPSADSCGSVMKGRFANASTGGCAVAAEARKANAAPMATELRFFISTAPSCRSLLPDVLLKETLQIRQHLDAGLRQRQVVVVVVEGDELDLLAGALQRIALGLALRIGHGGVELAVHDEHGDAHPVGGERGRGGVDRGVVARLADAQSPKRHRPRMPPTPLALIAH